MELSKKFLERIVFNKRPILEEHWVIVMDKATHEEKLS